MNDNRGKFKKLFSGILRQKLFRFLLIPAVLLIVFVFLFYGPFKSFKYFLDKFGNAHKPFSISRENVLF